MDTASLEELADIKATLLALRKIADQGLLIVEKLELKAASPRKQPKTRQPRVKYTTLILSGRRATKQNINRPARG